MTNLINSNSQNNNNNNNSLLQISPQTQGKSKSSIFHFFDDNMDIPPKDAKIQEKRFSFFRNIQSYIINVPENKLYCKQLLETVCHPSMTAYNEEGLQHLSDNSKIQYCVNKLAKTYLSPQSHSPSLAHLENQDNLIQALIRQILYSDSEDIKNRAQYALLCLEKLDPLLSPLNHQIASYLDSHDKESQEKAYKRLAHWAQNPPKQLELNFPMKSHVIPQNAPAYASLISKDLPTTSLSSQKTHNDFWTPEEIMVGSGGRCCFENLQEIAKKEGISKIHLPINISEWLRDPVLILDNHEILVPSRLAILPADNQKANFLQCLFMNDAQQAEQKKFFSTIIKICSDEPVNTIGVMGNVAQDQTTEKLLQAGVKGIREAPFYFEGGNLIPSINQNGEIVYLCGSHNILISILNSFYTFSSKEEKIELLKELKSFENSALFDQENLLFVQERLEKVDLLKQFSPEEKLWIAKLMLTAAKHVEKLIASHLGKPIVVLGDIFQLQPEFHLDLFLLPAPEGTVFIQDHALCIDVIDKISQHYNLSSKEKERLATYRQMAEEKQKRDGKKLAQAAEKLRAEGYRVIPVPGSFYKQSHGLPVVNFLNAIVGIGSEGKFCITNGSSASVDRYLRDAWTDIINSQGFKNVYFIGKKNNLKVGSSPYLHNYTEADEGLTVGGGIHCRVQEINQLQKGFAFTGDESAVKTITNSLECFWDSLPQFFQEMLSLKETKQI